MHESPSAVLSRCSHLVQWSRTKARRPRDQVPVLQVSAHELDRALGLICNRGDDMFAHLNSIASLCWTYVTFSCNTVRAGDCSARRWPPTGVKQVWSVHRVDCEFALWSPCSCGMSVSCLVLGLADHLVCAPLVVSLVTLTPGRLTVCGLHLSCGVGLSCLRLAAGPSLENTHTRIVRRRARKHVRCNYVPPPGGHPICQRHRGPHRPPRAVDSHLGVHRLCGDPRPHRLSGQRHTATAARRAQAPRPSKADEPRTTRGRELCGSDPRADRMAPASRRRARRRGVGWLKPGEFAKFVSKFACKS